MLEPTYALGRRAVSEAFGADRSAFHALQMVVANSRGCLKTGGDIGIVNDVALLGAVRPDTREAVGL